MIISNLKNTFPEKSDQEITLICKKFYKNFTDILLEAIKGFSMSAKEIVKRYEFMHDDKLDDFFKNKQSVIATTAHLANWEWGAYASGITLKHQVFGVYKKVSQPFINKYLIKSRSKFNVILSEMKETASHLDQIKPEKPLILMLISDQRPSDPYKAYWTKFLNRDTAFFYGAEKFAMQYDLPVLFFNIHRKKRGYYYVTVDWIKDNTDKFEKGQIIEKYRSVLEKAVLERPEEWLWSHSRWKHPKPKDLIQD